MRLQGRMPREPSCSDFVVGACSRRSCPWIRLAVASIHSVDLPRNCPAITPSGQEPPREIERDAIRAKSARRCFRAAVSCHRKTTLAQRWHDICIGADHYS